jgi:acetoacetate decarboxylase
MSFVKTYEEILGNSAKSGDFHDAEMLTLIWETTPEAIERLLPPPLKPAEKPLVLAFVADYPSTNFSLPYKESALLIRASFESKEGFYCLAMPVTNDMAMAGGREIWGYPKKLANISLQRTGDTVEGWTERHGIQFMKVTANLTGKLNDNSAMDELLGMGLNPEGEYSDIQFNFKHSPSPVAGEAFDYPPRLIQGETVFRPKTFTFAEVEIELTPSEFDPWHEVPVARMLGGFYSVGDNSMLNDGKVLAEVDSIEFAPYAFLKWEWGKGKS